MSTSITGEDTSRQASPAVDTPEHALVAIALDAMESNPNIAVVLAGVCRRWREIILFQPNLWYHLALGATDPTVKAHTWLARSKGGVVKLDLTPGFDSAKNGEFLSNMRGLNSQIRHLSIRGRHKVADFGWQHSFAKLESLTFHNDRWCKCCCTLDTFGTFDLDLCETLSNLRRIDYKNVTLSCPQPQQDLKSLKSIEFDSVIFHATIFSKMPKLRSLKLYQCSETEENYEITDDTHWVKLYRLRHLEIVGGIIPLIVAPYLSHLEVFGRTRRMGFEEPLLFDMVVRVSYPSRWRFLTYVAFSFKGRDDDELLKVLPFLVQVRFLGFAKCAITDETLRKLRGDDVEPICPNLVALSLAKTKVSPRGVKDLVNSRLPEAERIMVRSVQETAAASGPLTSSSSSHDHGQKSCPGPLPAHAQTASTSGPGQAKGKGKEEEIEEEKQRQTKPAPIQWLCLDGLWTEKHWGDCRPLIPVFEERISHLWADCSKSAVAYSDRTRGVGEYSWDAKVIPRQRRSLSATYKSKRPPLPS